MDNKTEKINFSIAIFNLLTIASANEIFFNNSFIYNNHFVPSLIFLSICSFLNVYVIFKKNNFLLLLTHSIFVCYLFYYFEKNYMGQSYFFWINGILLWLLLNLFHKKISYESRINTVQFYLISCYSLAGFQKLFNLFLNKNIFTTRLALVSSLLSDYVFLFKGKSYFLDLMYDYSLLLNIIIGIIIFTQVSLIFFYSQKNKLTLAAFLLVFHMANSLFLGISFIHAIYTLIIFFIVPLVNIDSDAISIRRM